MLDQSKTLLPTSLKVGGAINTPPSVTEGALRLIVEAIMNETKARFGIVDGNITKVENLAKNHTHSTDTITSMKGYVKASTSGAISPTDPLNVAIGKLEKSIEGKQNVGNYAQLNHKHSKADISDFPSVLPNPNQLNIKVGSTTHDYNGSTVKEVIITPQTIGAAPTIHDHNTLYNTKAEITGFLANKLDKNGVAVSSNKLATARTIGLAGAVTGSGTFDGSANITINTVLGGFDASKITTGIINIDRLPKTAISEFVAVANKEARLKLTKTQVQIGDTVKETDTKRMFLVIDDNKLNTDAGYQEYTTVVDWATITGKPSTFNPSTHNHTWGQITDRPTTMANPHPLTISLNGKPQTAYTGSSAIAFNITPASIGAQVAGSYAAASHTHTEYQAKGNYAMADHNHNSAYAPLNHTHTQYQPIGNYAQAIHNHDNVYSKTDHTHPYLPINGGDLTGTVVVPKNNGFKYVAADGSKKWFIHNNNGTEIGIGYSGSGQEVPVRVYGDLYSNNVHRVWHAGNFNPSTKADTSHTHDDRYQPKGNYQPAGNYADSNHTHSYLPLSGGRITGELTISGNLTSANVITTSDRRLKHDIEKIINATDKVSQINGYTFQKDGDNQRSVGLIAQEVQKVLPEAVFENDEGYLCVTYGNLVGLLVESIKELKAEIDSLKALNK